MMIMLDIELVHPLQNWVKKDMSSVHLTMTSSASIFTSFQ